MRHLIENFFAGLSNMFSTVQGNIMKLKEFCKGEHVHSALADHGEKIYIVGGKNVGGKIEEGKNCLS